MKRPFLFLLCVVPALALSGFFDGGMPRPDRGGDASGRPPEKDRWYWDQRNDNAFGKNLPGFDEAVEKANEDALTHIALTGSDPGSPRGGIQLAIVIGPKPETKKHYVGDPLFRLVSAGSPKGCEPAGLEPGEWVFAYYTSKMPDPGLGVDDPLFPLFAKAWCERIPVIHFDPATKVLTQRVRAETDAWRIEQGTWVPDESSTAPGAKGLEWHPVEKTTGTGRPPRKAAKQGKSAGFGEVDWEWALTDPGDKSGIDLEKILDSWNEP